MRMDKWTALWLVAVVSLVLVLVLELLGAISLSDLTANPILLLVGIVIVAVLSAVGAMFLGVFLTQRVFASSQFTPFEREMLAMREEVRQIREQVEALLRRLEGEPKG